MERCLRLFQARGRRHGPETGGPVFEARRSTLKFTCASFWSNADDFSAFMAFVGASTSPICLGQHKNPSSTARIGQTPERLRNALFRTRTSHGFNQVLLGSR